MGTPTNPVVQILDKDGNAFMPSKAKMLTGWNTPLDAADNNGDHNALWNPFLWAADNINPFRDRVVARTRDLVDNDGWASGSIQRLTDDAIGAGFRPISKPHYLALQRASGIKAFDAKWADEFGKALDSYFWLWSNDQGKWCDIERSMTMPQMWWTAFRHEAVDGDSLMQCEYRPDRVGFGRARYATCVRLIDPDRLSNPNLNFDSQTQRGGVEIDADGAPVGYWIRQAHMGEWFSGAKSVTWKYVPRETSWGRPIVVHGFERKRAGQHRGVGGILTPVLNRLKMLIKYDGTELDAAIINAIFGAYIESPFDQEMVQEALGDNLSQYQQLRTDFHKDRRLVLGGARMPHLFPGEKINMLDSKRPSSNYDPFQQNLLRHIGQATGQAAPQVTNNWSDLNYSSYKGASNEAWKTLTRRRLNFSVNVPQQVRMALLEEIFDLEDLPLPKGAPGFVEMRAAYSRALWMGPGRGVIDTVAERQGAQLGMEIGVTTLEDECAESSGTDWEENLDQRKIEVDAFKERGLPLPEWANDMMKEKRAGESSGSHDPSSPNYRSA